MSTNISVGKSKIKDTVSAAKEAVRGAMLNISNDKPTVIFVYSTFGYDFKLLLDTIKKESNNSVVIGGSVFGIIDKDGFDTELNRILICAISSNDFKMTPIFASGLKESSLLVGENLRDQILDKKIADIKGLYLMMDGLHAIDPDSMLNEISKSLPKNTAVFGGSTAEPLLWKNTYQFYDGKVFENSAVGIIFSGNIIIDVTSSHGSQELGGEHFVTKAEGSRIYEIDNKPALSLFTELYGEEQKEINAVTAAGVCLGTKIHSKDGGENHLELRIPLSSNPDKSIVMAAAWPIGTQIYICQRNIELIASKNIIVIEELLKRHNGKKPLLVFESDCLGRSADQIGKEAAKNDIDSAQDAFNREPIWFGAYLYGELASIEDIAAFHNWTGGFACFYLD